MSLDIRAGRTLALVGESGCGKTTAGKALLKLIDATAGSITLDGVDLGRARGDQLRALRAQVLSTRVSVDWPALMQSGSDERLAELMARRSAGGADVDECRHAEFAAEQLDYAFDVLEARGELEPDSDEAR